MRAIKRRLGAGEVVTAVSLNHPAPSLVEQIGRHGFDIVLVDCEKYSFTTERIDDIARAGRAAGVAVMVRPWLNEPGLISRCLDLGADGIMMAGSDTIVAARGLAEAVRYARYQDYESKLVVAMVESPEGVERLPELLEVEGIDVWSIGANDLAQRMGLPGQAHDRRVQDEVDRAIDAIVSRGRTCGILGTFENVRQRMAQGVRYLSTSVNELLAHGAADYRRLLNTEG